MAYDHAPIKNTCPRIDDGINELYYVKRVIDENEADAIESINAVRVILEEMREANDTLRTWGNEQFNRAEEFEQDLDRANDKISTLDSDIAYYSSKVDELQSEVDEQYDTIGELRVLLQESKEREDELCAELAAMQQQVYELQALIA